MAKTCLPKGSGKVREKSGNFEMDIEWQPWYVMEYIRSETFMATHQQSCKT